MKQKKAGFIIIIDKYILKQEKLPRIKSGIIYDKGASYPRKQNAL